MRAVLVDGAGHALFPPKAVTTTVGLLESHPEVDGDGVDFVVAWSAPVPTSDATRVARVSVGPAGLEVLPWIEQTGFLDAAVHPRVAYTPGKALVSLATAFFLGSNPGFFGVDPKMLGVCESLQQPGGATANEAMIALATASSGGALGDGRGLLAWSSTNGDAYAHLVGAHGSGGPVQGLGGALSNRLKVTVGE